MSTTQRRGATFIREVSIRYRGARLKTNGAVHHPLDAVRLAKKIVHDDARGHFVALYLDSRHQAIAYSVVSVGTAKQSLVHPREVFQSAVVLHNHPSGNPTPSREDHDVTKRLRDAGQILGIRLLDHVIWTREGRYHSFAQNTPDSLSS